MGKSQTLIGGITAALILVGVLVFAFYSQSSATPQLSPLFRVPHLGTSTETVAQRDTLMPATRTFAPSIVTTSGVERWYTNTILKFSFQLPDGFSAPEVDTGVKGVYGVQVYNDPGALLTVVVHPIAAGSTITAAGIRDNLPGVTIYNVQDAVIGTVVRAVRFRNNAEEWGGDGVSVWAVYNGHVYQLSVARKDEELLNFVITHWFFAPPAPTRP